MGKNPFIVLLMMWVLMILATGQDDNKSSIGLAVLILAYYVGKALNDTLDHIYDKTDYE